MGGLRRGDVIVEFNGERIEEMNELPRVVANTRVGSEVDVVVVRKGSRKTIEVTLGEMPGDDNFVPASAPSRSQLGGLRLQPLTDELAGRLGVDSSEGVLIAEVDPGTAAEDAGLRRGDIILEVNQQPVLTAADVHEYAGDDKSVLMLVKRREGTQYLVIKTDRS